MFCCDELNFNIEYIDNFSMDYDALNNSDLFVASIEPNEDYFKMIFKIKPLLEDIIKE